MNGGDSVIDGVAGAPGGLSQPVLELGEDHLDGIEVWGVLGQEEEPGARGADGGADRLSSVRSQIDGVDAPLRHRCAKVVSLIIT